MSCVRGQRVKGRHEADLRTELKMVSRSTLVRQPRIRDMDYCVGRALRMSDPLHFTGGRWRYRPNERTDCFLQLRHSSFRFQSQREADACPRGSYPALV